LWALEHLVRRDCLLILNYHRIGDPSSTDFDSGVFSATAEEFRAQIVYLRNIFTIITLDEAVELASHWTPCHRPRLLITFDDGYSDNYSIAFPILRSLSVPAAFFIVSSNVGNPAVPWWDRIAWWVRHTGRPFIRLNYPAAHEFQLSSGRRGDTIRALLRLFKSPATGEPDRFLAELELACEPTEPLPSAKGLFIDTKQAREMIQGGMGFGSHTHTHRMLAKLSSDVQLAELTQSREILSQAFGIDITALAYPVGGLNAFSETTQALLPKAGYRAAFSFYGG
jgi:peptidoglycan/xylan/chitin deacetylase (PgdA/CDA1 family)